MTFAKHDTIVDLPRDPPGWAIRALMLSGGLLGAMALVAITAVLPKIETALARGPGDGLLIKQLIGIVSLAMVGGAPLAGVLVDRIGLRPTLVASALVYAAAGTAGLYLNSLPLLLVSRLLLGVAAASVQIVSITLINTRLIGTDRAKWIGWHMAFAMAGTIVVNPIAGLLGEISWRLPFALYGIAMLIVPVALADPAFGRKAVAPTMRAVPPPNRRGGLGWFPVHYALLALFMGGITYVPMIYAPFLLRQHGMESSALIALVLTVDSILGAVMAVLYGRARHYLSAHVAFAISFAATGLGTCVAALSPGVAGVVAGMAIFGFGVGWFIANLLTALAAKVGTAQQGRATGYTKAAHFLSAPLCVLLMEPLSRRFGPQGVMLAVSVTALVLLLVMLARIAETRRRNRDIVVVQDVGVNISAVRPARRP
jgi:MFS family permease